MKIQPRDGKNALRDWRWVEANLSTFANNMEKQKKGLPKRDEAREPMDLTGGLGAGGDELIILEARYGWTQDLWNAKQLATTALSGFKDVTAIVQADVSNNELRLDPKEDPTWYEKHFDFGIFHYVGGVRRLGIRYKFGKEGAEEVFMSKTRHKRHGNCSIPLVFISERHLVDGNLDQMYQY